MLDTNNYCDNLRILQVELSTVCNALCLGCVRTDGSNFNKQKAIIPKAKYLDINIIKDLFASEKAKTINKIEFCGNIDEPLAHPHLLELLEHLYTVRPDLRVSIHTNGGLGTPEKFLKLSQLMSKFESKSDFRFSFDGLGDTNHIYRQNVRWNTAFANLKAAIDGGAKVIWQFLVFPWNEHQVEEAQQLALEVGCHEYWVRPDRSLVTSTGLETVKFRKEKNIPGPAEAKGALSDLRKYVRLKGNPIACSFKQHGMLFLSWEGKVWPCCFISNILYDSQLKKRIFEKHFNSRYPENFNSLRHNSFDEILDGPLFKKDLVKSWDNGGSESKLAFRCVERCSTASVRASDKKPDNRSCYSKLDLKRNIPLPP